MTPALRTTDEAFDRFSATLDRDGLRDALAELLSLTDYRFIAIFSFQGDRANAAVFDDREQPNVTTTVEVPAKATYCSFVRDARGVFSTADAMHDTRIADHPKREVVQSYCGVPVITAEGDILGTLCHYDLVPRDPTQLDLELMLRVASLLAYRNLVPPYPSPSL